MQLNMAGGTSEKDFRGVRLASHPNPSRFSQYVKTKWCIFSRFSSQNGKDLGQIFRLEVKKNSNQNVKIYAKFQTKMARKKPFPQPPGIL